MHDPLEDEFPLGDGNADTETMVDCPYCGEAIEIGLDPGGGELQHYVEDCSVCCQPIQIRLEFTRAGSAIVNAHRLDD
jgi:hypothetical protein